MSLFGSLEMFWARNGVQGSTEGENGFFNYSFDIQGRRMVRLHPQRLVNSNSTTYNLNLRKHRAWIQSC